MVHVYGGPHSQSVRNQYLGDSPLHAEAQLGYMVFRMDNRGTANRGKAFETATYLKLGQVDLADQVAGVNYVTGRPYIDGSRVGVTGGSYGGYMVCMALLAAPDVFQVGVGVSSVTHWKNYDTIYTERYMQRPKDNPEGYEKGAAMPYAKDLKGKLLLIHGTIDNNVHPSNTIQLVRKLIEAGKRFDLMFYPEHRHGIYGPARQHLRRLSREYFARHLQPEHWKELIE
jgi:dipeptidyl-peptidase-4